jgi:hypothetical protein
VLVVEGALVVVELVVDVDSVVEEEVGGVGVDSDDVVDDTEEDVGSGVTPTGPCVEAISADVVVGALDAVAPDAPLEPVLPEAEVEVVPVPVDPDVPVVPVDSETPPCPEAPVEPVDPEAPEVPVLPDAPVTPVVPVGAELAAGAEVVPLELTGPFIAAVNVVTVVVTVVVVLFTTVIPLA